MDFNQKRPKVFYGWYIVVACLLIIIYTQGVIQFGFTAVFEPIAKEFGWNYTQVSLAASLRGIEVGFLAPLIGLLVDRWGPRRLIFVGSILLCGGLLLLSRISSLATYYGAFALIAIGMSTCTSTVFMTTVIHWFRRKANMAVGIVASGTGLGGLMVLALTKLIDVLQWRMAMVAIGLGMLVIVLPLSLLLRHKPEQYGYEPDGEVGSTVKTVEAKVPTVSVEVDTSAKQALMKRTFWHMAIASSLHSFVVGAVVTHIMPYLGSLGITRYISSMAALVLLLATIGGRISGGWLADRFGNRQVCAAGFALMTAGILFFAYVTTGRMWLLVPFIISFSFGWGCSGTAKIALQREYFGRGSFGTILGFISGITMLGNMAGTPLAGWVFDTWGTYQGAWLSYSVIILAGATLIFTLPSSGNAIQKPDQP
ncbi:MFS transporter [Chloroflexota bacterium]